MKNSIINDIFYGKRGCNNVRAEKSGMWKIFDKYIEQIKAGQNPEQLKLTCAFEEAFNNAFSEEADFYYIEGFKLGVLTGVECSES